LLLQVHVQHLLLFLGFTSVIVVVVVVIVGLRLRVKVSRQGCIFIARSNWV